MGVVYVILDREGLTSAAKTYDRRVFEGSQARAERFRLEALTWIRLGTHSNVVRALGFVTLLGGPFLFLEFVPGGDLSAWIHGKRLAGDLPLVLRMATDLCDGMIHILNNGVRAHRDLKPQNCLITAEGRLKVTDFGLAKVFDSNDEAAASDGSGHLRQPGEGFTNTGAAFGTPAYMAPEQFNDAKRTDQRADIYSFGIMFYEMLTGERAFAATTWDGFKQLHQNAPLPTLADRELTDVLHRCLAKNPGARYQTFDELRDQLIRASRGVPMANELRGQVTSHLSTNSEAGSSLLVKATGLMGLGRPAEALILVDRAIAIEPHVRNHWVARGQLLDQLGRPDESIVSFDRAIGLDPTYQRAWTLKGLTLQRRGRMEAAIDCYNQVLAVDAGEIDQYVTAFQMKAKALAAHTRRSNEALACLSEGVVILPLAEPLWSEMGLLLGQDGRNEEAKQCLERATQLDSKSFAAWANLGWVLLDLGRCEEALPCFDRAIEIEPNEPQPWENKAACLDALGRTAEVLECCERLLGNAPSSFIGWYARGRSHSKMGAFTEAVRSFERACHLDPENWGAWGGLGDALGRAGRTQEALAALERARRLGDPEAPARIALYRSKLNK